MMQQGHDISASRVSLLRQAIARSGFVRIIEAHSGLSALVGEAAVIEAADGPRGYDGLWESSLTDSASKGWPDAEIIGVDSRIHTIDEILQVTTKPLIVDGDTGRTAIEFQYLVRRLERLGVSAVIIEDKVFPKRNSLDPTANQTLEDPRIFARKIARGKQAVVSYDFMIMARIESLIAGAGLADALERARVYVEAGADGIMIHSQRSEPDEILAFAAEYQKLYGGLPSRPALVCVPTTYNQITDIELAEAGFNVIIHANHLLRASYKAMGEAAQAILTSDRGLESEPALASTKEIFTAVGFDRIKEQDREDSTTERLSVIIPSAGKDPVFGDAPKSLIKIAGRPILDHQLESLSKAGLTNNPVFVVRGHEGGQFTQTSVSYVENDRFLETHSLYSLFRAESKMTGGFVLVYSDVLFDPKLMRGLVDTEGDIVLLVDRSYRYHEHDVDKKLDLVTSPQTEARSRQLKPEQLVKIATLGKTIPIDTADYEFVGIAYFSERGAEILREVYADAEAKASGLFHEGPTFAQAQITDLLQEIIDRGFPVDGLVVNMGWIEIHNARDQAIAERQLASASRGPDDDAPASR